MCVLANILHEISGKVLLDMFYEREKTLTHDACVFSLRRKRETIVRTTVAWMDTSERILATSRMKGERIIWISDRRDSRGIALPRHHIFAVRQEDGTHRFFGSHEPEKI